MSNTFSSRWVVAAALLAVLAGPSRARPEAPVEARHCPKCNYHARSVPDARALDTLRIEGIKQQILSKLGLRAKPNVTSSIPREVLIQTLYRSQEDIELLQQPQVPAQQDEEDLLEDDYYAKTSEIISFAEPGKCRCRIEFEGTPCGEERGEGRRRRVHTTRVSRIAGPPVCGRREYIM